MKMEFFENLVLYLGCRQNEPSAGIMRFDIDSSLFIYISIYVFPTHWMKKRLCTNLIASHDHQLLYSIVKPNLFPGKDLSSSFGMGDERTQVELGKRMRNLWASFVQKAQELWLVRYLQIVSIQELKSIFVMVIAFYLSENWFLKKICMSTHFEAEVNSNLRYWFL